MLTEVVTQSLDDQFQPRLTATQLQAAFTGDSASGEASPVWQSLLLPTAGDATGPPLLDLTAAHLRFNQLLAEMLVATQALAAAAGPALADGARGVAQAARSHLPLAAELAVLTTSAGQTLPEQVARGTRQLQRRLASQAAPAFAAASAASVATPSRRGPATATVLNTQHARTPHFRHAAPTDESWESPVASTRPSTTALTPAARLLRSVQKLAPAASDDATNVAPVHDPLLAQLGQLAAARQASQQTTDQPAPARGQAQEDDDEIEYPSDFESTQSTASEGQRRPKTAPPRAPTIAPSPATRPAPKSALKPQVSVRITKHVHMHEHVKPKTPSASPTATTSASPSPGPTAATALFASPRPAVATKPLPRSAAASARPPAGVLSSPSPHPSQAQPLTHKSRAFQAVQESDDATLSQQLDLLSISNQVANTVSALRTVCVRVVFMRVR